MKTKGYIVARIITIAECLRMTEVSRIMCAEKKEKKLDFET